jgi:hypothetical protein
VTRLGRTLALCLLALFAVAATGCGGPHETRTEGDTEGLYIEVEELTYQIQMSRILNPAATDDRDYLVGLAEGIEPASDEVWFGIWLRVQNLTDETHASADRFEIVDTTERSYRPIVLDRATNVFQYSPDPVTPGEIVPQPNTPAFDGPIQGELILFKVKVESLYNRPLEFRISNSSGGDTGIIDIDV